MWGLGLSPVYRTQVASIIWVSFRSCALDPSCTNYLSFPKVSNPKDILPQKDIIKLQAKDIIVQQKKKMDHLMEPTFWRRKTWKSLPDQNRHSYSLHLLNSIISINFSSHILYILLSQRPTCKQIQISGKSISPLLISD